MISILWAFNSAVLVALALAPWDVASRRHAITDAVMFGLAVFSGLMSVRSMLRDELKRQLQQAQAEWSA